MKQKQQFNYHIPHPALYGTINVCPLGFFLAQRGVVEGVHL